MIDGEDFVPIKPNMDKCLVLGGKPEFADFLILAHKLRAGDPKGERLGWMAGDPDYRVVLGVDPNPAFEQVFVLALGESFDNQAVMGTEILLSQEVESVVRRFYRAIAMCAS